MNLVAAQQTAGWMMDDELEWLALQAASCQTIIEVGCWQGRSTLALADNTPGRVWAVDHWRGTAGDPHLAEVRKLGGPNGLFAQFQRNIGDRNNVTAMRMDANDAAAVCLPQFADLVFLDASHAYADVKRDIQTFRPLVKPGGILCGHDYACPSHPGVQQAVDECFPKVNRAGLSIWWVQV